MLYFRSSGSLFSAFVSLKCVMILWCKCSLSLFLLISWFLFSVCESLSLLSLFSFFFSLFQTLSNKSIFQNLPKEVYCSLSLSLSFRLVPLPWFCLFLLLPLPLMSWFSAFSLFCVHYKHDLCLTRMYWTFYLNLFIFFKKNWTALSVTAASDEDFFHRVNLFFPTKQAVLPPGQVKCSDTFKRVFLGSMTQYNFPVWGVQIVNCLKSTLYFQQLSVTNNLLACILWFIISRDLLIQYYATVQKKKKI